VADDLGYNDIGYHNPLVKTPNLGICPLITLFLAYFPTSVVDLFDATVPLNLQDRLAREGIILEQNYVLPSCSPSREDTILSLKRLSHEIDFKNLQNLASLKGAAGF
jgi:arylsulfatase A-like enzyme